MLLPIKPKYSKTYMYCKIQLVKVENTLTVHSAVQMIVLSAHIFCSKITKPGNCRKISHHWLNLQNIELV